jgi:hypothetical protein
MLNVSLSMQSDLVASRQLDRNVQILLDIGDELLTHRRAFSTEDDSRDNAIHARQRTDPTGWRRVCAGHVRSAYGRRPRSRTALLPPGPDLSDDLLLARPAKSFGRDEEAPGVDDQRAAEQGIVFVLLHADEMAPIGLECGERE